MLRFNDWLVQKGFYITDEEAGIDPTLWFDPERFDLMGFIVAMEKLREDDGEKT
jgi:hypothetical protein